MEEIILRVGEDTFQVKKNVLCEHSDYFRAMFSGNYIEDQLKEISIPDILESSIMSVIVQYMNTNVIDLFEHSLSIIAQIATAADFLQITALNKQTEHTLYTLLCEENWLEVMAIGEKYPYPNLEKYSLAFGLYSFKTMKPEHIPSIHKLVWYLSHPYLDVECELDVFYFGVQWIRNHEMADALLIISCLDFKRLTQNDMREIKDCINEQFASASEVVDCLSELLNNGLEISETALNKLKSELKEKFTEKAWNEAVGIVKESKSRLLNYTVVASLIDFTKTKSDTHDCLSTLNYDTGFENWLQVMKRPIDWRVCSWGLTKLVFLYKQSLLDRDVNWKIKVYDILKKEWTFHDMSLQLNLCLNTASNTLHEYTRLVIVNDSLYIFGLASDDIDKNGWSLSYKTVVIYDLKQKMLREIAEIPKPLGLLATCAHKNKVYIALERHIYYHEDDSGGLGCWKPVLSFQCNEYIYRMTSYKGSIHYVTCYKPQLFKFTPNIDEDVSVVTRFSGQPSSVTRVGNTLVTLIGDGLIRFVYNEGGLKIVSVELYQNDKEDTPEEVYRETDENVRLHIRDVLFAVVLTYPPLCEELSQYHNKYLNSLEL